MEDLNELENGVECINEFNMNVLIWNVHENGHLRQYNVWLMIIIVRHVYFIIEII